MRTSDPVVDRAIVLLRKIDKKAYSFGKLAEMLKMHKSTVEYAFKTKRALYNLDKVGNKNRKSSD